MAKYTKAERAMRNSHAIVEDFHARKHAQKARVISRKQARELRAMERDSELALVSFARTSIYK